MDFPFSEFVKRFLNYTENQQFEKLSCGKVCNPKNQNCKPVDRSWACGTFATLSLRGGTTKQIADSTELIQKSS